MHISFHFLKYFRSESEWGILTSGKDFFLTSGMKSNSHQWDKKFIPLVRKKYFPLVRIFKKKNSHQWEEKGGNGGRARQGPISNVFRSGFGSKSMEMRSKARIKSYTLYFGLQQGICKKQKYMHINVNL